MDPMSKSRVEQVLRHHHPGLTLLVAGILGVYAAARLLVLVRLMYTTGVDDLFYMTRQLVYTVAWSSLAYFMLGSYREQTDETIHINRQLQPDMERSAFLAMVVCLITGALIVVYNVMYYEVNSTELLTLSAIMEVVAWFSMAVFFFFFRFRHRQAREEMDQSRLSDQDQQDAEYEELMRKLK